MMRKVSMAAVLAGAVGVPYAVWNGDEAMQLADGWFSGEEQAESESDVVTPRAQPVSQSRPYTSTQPALPGNYYDPTAHGPQGDAKSAQYGYPQATTTGPVTISLAEVLSMDVSHEWVTQNFTRVTTTLADTGYDGLRVPLVTGTSETAFTGSLTYYFDESRAVKRITLHGTMGNTMELSALLTQLMEFEQKECLGGELYTRGWRGGTNSVCRIRPAGVLHAGATNTRYEVLLEMNRPQWTTNLSDAAQQLLK